MENFPLALVALFVVFFAYLSWMRRAWAVYFIVGFLPIYVIRFELGALPSTLLEVMILVLTAVFVVKKWKHRRKWKLPWLLPVGMLIAASCVALVISPDTRAGFGMFKAYIIEPLLFFYVALNTLHTKKEFEHLLWALGASTLPIAAMTIAQLLNFSYIPAPWNDGFKDLRTTALYPYPNAVGLYVAPIVALFIGVTWDAKYFDGRKRIAAVVIIALGIMSILAAVSQGALFGIAVAFFFFGFFATPWWRIPLLLTLCVAIAFAISTTREMLIPLVTFTDVSGDVRHVLWQGTWNLLQARPITGAGLAGFPIVYETYKLAKHTEFLLYPHNILLNFWVELGLAGVVTFSWILGLFFKKCAAVFRRGTDFSRLSVAVMGGMVALLAHGVVDVSFFKNDLAVLFWVFPLLILSLERIESQE
ncbi:MAG: O-antigen ligase family protein [Candidatus Kerfeldbacteria bacterium]|nr:O-antigen ligase family protein [Candidatus Kerfeldbacteria bacterium]